MFVIYKDIGLKNLKITWQQSFTKNKLNKIIDFEQWGKSKKIKNSGHAVLRLHFELFFDFIYK